MGKVLDRQDTWKGSAWQPWTQNLYVYVGNNPVNYVDPTGHSRSCSYGSRVHCLVEQYFVGIFEAGAEPGIVADYEVVNAGGYADMVLSIPGLPPQVYELKPISYSPEGSPQLNAEGKDQLNRYVVALQGVPGFTWNPDGWTLLHPDDPNKELVLKTYPGETGMIYYYERERKTNDQPQDVPLTDPVEVPWWVWLLMGAAAAAGGGGSGNTDGSPGNALHP